ncbi:hypothetical protein LSAT2_024574 [Lamellibrachia satsuma]|nr:hypothetical protein LSAT2_024574 [Lamellibrachia satsuma]
MVLGNGSASAPVQIEVFLELLCPDSRDAWRILKTLSRVYEATKLRIVIHQFPLPYHSNGFVVTQTLFQVAHMKPEKTYTYMERIFHDMGRYSNERTMDKTPNTVLRDLAAKMSDVTGMQRQDILNNHELYYISVITAWKYAARRKYCYYCSVITAWKYAARRGVAGTPWHFVNGVELRKNSVPLSIEEYRVIIDSLLNRLSKNDDTPVHSYLIADPTANTESAASVISQQVALILLLVSGLAVL